MVSTLARSCHISRAGKRESFRFTTSYLFDVVESDGSCLVMSTKV